MTGKAIPHEGMKIDVISSNPGKLRKTRCCFVACWGCEWSQIVETNDEIDRGIEPRDSPVSTGNLQEILLAVGKAAVPERRVHLKPIRTASETGVSGCAIWLPTLRAACQLPDQGRVSFSGNSSEAGVH